MNYILGRMEYHYICFSIFPPKNTTFFTFFYYFILNESKVTHQKPESNIGKIVVHTTIYSLRFYLFATFWFTQEFRRCHFHSFLMYFLTPLPLNKMGKGKKSSTFWWKKRGNKYFLRFKISATFPILGNVILSAT